MKLFDQSSFASCLGAYRRSEGYGVRQAAKEAGISPSEFNRIERGEGDAQCGAFLQVVPMGRL